MACRVLLLIVGVLGVTANVKLMIGANHKSGSRLSAYFQGALFRAPCPTNVTVKPRNYHFGGPIQIRDVHYVIFQRNPFAMIASGYEYHKRGLESWIRSPMGSIGTGSIARNWMRYDIARPEKGESYLKYLNRIPQRDGLIAESLRCMAEEFGRITSLARGLAKPGASEHTRKVCLEDVMFDQAAFNATFLGLYRWLGVPCAEETFRWMYREGPANTYDQGRNANHMGDHGDTRHSELDQLAVMDHELFGDKIAATADKVGCALRYVPRCVAVGTCPTADHYLYTSQPTA